MANYDDLKVAVEALTGGNNSVIFDVDGYPSIVVKFDKKQIADRSRAAAPAHIRRSS